MWLLGALLSLLPVSPPQGLSFCKPALRTGQNRAEQKEGGEPERRERREREADMAHFRNKKAPCGDNKWKNYAFNLEEGRRNNHEMNGRNSGAAEGRQNGGRCNR